MPYYIPLVYWLIISLVAFAMMGIDKRKAKKHLWRISEKSLVIVALLGGSVGTIAGMKFFRHKTLHWKFKYGMPSIFMIQLILLGAFLYWRYFGQ